MCIRTHNTVLPIISKLIRVRHLKAENMSLNHKIPWMIQPLRCARHKRPPVIPSTTIYAATVFVLCKKVFFLFSLSFPCRHDHPLAQGDKKSVDNSITASALVVVVTKL